MKFILLFCLYFCINVVHGEKKRYDGFKVYKLHPNSIEQSEDIMQMKANNKYDFWSHSEVMVKPNDQEYFLDLMETKGIATQMAIEDVQRVIENTISVNASEGMSWNDYHKLEVIHSWMDLQAEKYPEIVESISAGQSYEKRNLKGLKLTFNPKNKKAVFIEGGIHAREWISSATVTYLINELLTNQDTEFRNLVEQVNWYIFPLFNPDGFVYSHEMDRLWRKNRRPIGKAFGVDLNRNWNYKWGGAGTDPDPTAETYAGTHAFSEPETIGLSRFISERCNELIAYIAFHSFKQLMIIPYGDSDAHLDNYDELKLLGDKAAKAVASKYGTIYTVDTGPKTVGYACTGTSMDWTKQTCRTPITYTIELRPRTGNLTGFILPPEQILPNCEEIMEAMKVFLNKIKSMQ